MAKWIYILVFAQALNNLPDEQKPTNLYMNINAVDSLSRDAAKDALLLGKKVRHRYYTRDEYLLLNDGVLITEDGCRHGGFEDAFWSKYQVWPDGWEVID